MKRCAAVSRSCPRRSRWDGGCWLTCPTLSLLTCRAPPGDATMQSGSDGSPGPVTVWMTLVSRTSADALEAESMVRLTGDVSVLEARCPDEVSRCFCLLAQ